MPIAINNKTATISGVDTLTNSSGGAFVPTGVIQMYGGSSAPTGWLLCDGTAVSRTTYASLFTAIGTNFGVGNGTTTFNLPDLRGRSPIGAGTGSGLTARTLGTNYGAETHTLSTSELPSHTHSNTVSGGNTGNMSANASHTHTPAVDNVQLGRGAYGFSALGGGYQGLLILRGSDSGSSCTNTSTSVEHTHTFTPSISNASAGSGGAHANLHPVLTINYIIKA